MHEGQHIRVVCGLLVKVIVGMAMIAAGVFGSLGIWIPSMSGVWKGREKISFGRLTSAASSLLFICIGFAFLFSDAKSKLLNGGLFACANTAFVLMFCGYWLDSYAYDKAKRGYRLPGDVRTGDRIMFWTQAGLLLLFMALMIITFVFPSS